jgi:carbon storage regulator CsrA
MLVLTRRIEEEIRIGDNVSIKVVGIDGGKVRLGITAPPSVGILREELCGHKPGAGQRPPLRPEAVGHR